MYLQNYNQPANTTLAPINSRYELYRWLWEKANLKKVIKENQHLFDEDFMDEYTYEQVDSLLSKDFYSQSLEDQIRQLDQLEEAFSTYSSGDYYLSKYIYSKCLQNDNYGDGNSIYKLYKVKSEDNTEVALFMVEGTYSSWDSTEWYKCRPVKLNQVTLFETEELE